MHLVTNKRLLEFSAKYPQAHASLQEWRRIVEARSFANFAELKATFNATDKVGAYYLFDVGGNKYRIVAAVHFNTQRIYIRAVMTHKEYDSWKP